MEWTCKMTGFFRWRFFKMTGIPTSSIGVSFLNFVSTGTWIVRKNTKNTGMEKLHVTMPTSTACLSCHRLGESGWILCMYSFHMFFLPHLAWHHPFATLTELCLAYFGAVSNDTTLGTRFDSTPAWGKRCGSRLLRSLCQTRPCVIDIGWIWVNAVGAQLPNGIKVPFYFGINSP